MSDYLMHYGVSKDNGAPGRGSGRYPKGSGKRPFQREGKEKRVFVSGSSKTQFDDNPYYRKELPKPIRDELDKFIKESAGIIVGDAPGIDRQVQDYLKSLDYQNVTVYGPGKQVRYNANPKWATRPIDAPEFEEGSKEWLAKKDIAMTKDSTEGLAVILDEGAKATRKNVARMKEQGKEVKVYELSKEAQEFDHWVDELLDEATHSDASDEELYHYGVGPDDDPPGRGSGRYAKGTGKDPYQHDPVMKKKMGLFDAIGNRIKKFKEDREETKRIQKEWDEALFKLAEEGRRKEKRLEALAKARETRKANKEKAAAEKAEREKHEAEKKAAIASGDPEKISKFLTEMTNQEQYDAITRMGQVNKINAAAKAQADARAKAEAAANYKPSKLELAMSRTEKLLDGGMRVRDAAEKGIKIWNTMASLNNAFNDNFKMPKIDTSIPKPDDKKDKKPDGSNNDKKPDNRDFRFFDNSKAATNSNPNTPPYGSFKNQTSENRGNTENRDYSSNADSYVSKKERENNHANEKKSFEDVINKTRESRSSNDNAIDVEFREVKSETIRPLLSSLSSASKEDIKKAANAGSKYFMTVINGGGSYPGSSSESASNYARSRSEENRRYNEWESSQASASSQRMKNEERARQEASEKYTRESSQRENRLKREAQQYRYAERILEERIKARDADRERNNGNNWRHYDKEVKEAREDLDRLRKNYSSFRKYL